MTAEENDAEARKFLAARKAAPERPHPLAPQSGGLLHKAAAMQSKVGLSSVHYHLSSRLMTYLT